MKNQKLLIGATISVLLGAMLYFFVIRDKSADQTNQANTNQNTPSDSPEDSESQNTDDTPDPSDTETDDTPNQTDDDADEPKTPPVSVNVKEKPVLTNSSGNTSGSAVPADALVSSACATDARVECSLTFTNTDSGEVITFEAKKTDSQGIAIWEWTAGTDVGSGTWETYAKAGTKTSAKGVIYIQ